MVRHFETHRYILRLEIRSFLCYAVSTMSNEILVIKKPLQIVEFIVGPTVKLQRGSWVFAAQFTDGYISTRVSKALLKDRPQPGQWGVLVGEYHRRFVYVGRDGFCELFPPGSSETDRYEAIYRANQHVVELVQHGIQNYMQHKAANN